MYKSSNRQYGIFGPQNRQNDDKSSNLATMFISAFRIEYAYNVDIKLILLNTKYSFIHSLRKTPIIPLYLCPFKDVKK